MAHIGLAVAGGLSGAAPAAGNKTASPPPKGGEPTVNRQSAKVQEEVAQVVCARKMGDDVGDVAEVEVERKRPGASLPLPFPPGNAVTSAGSLALHHQRHFFCLVGRREKFSMKAEIAV